MDSIVLLHRLVVGIAVALFIVSVSTERPKTDYDAAEEELRSLQDAVEAASEQVDQAGLRLDHASQLEHALRTVSYHSGTRCVAVELRNGIQFDYFLPVPVRPGVRRKEIDHKNQPRTPRMSRLLALAHRFEALWTNGTVQSYRELAELGHLSRTRLSQIMKLAQLAPGIQEQLLFLPPSVHGPDLVFERHVRSIANVMDWDEQRQLFRSLWQQQQEGRNFWRAV